MPVSPLRHEWLSPRESNPHIEIQSLLYCRYTRGHLKCCCVLLRQRIHLRHHANWQRQCNCTAPPSMLIPPDLLSGPGNSCRFPVEGLQAAFAWHGVCKVFPHSAAIHSLKMAASKPTATTKSNRNGCQGWSRTTGARQGKRFTVSPNPLLEYLAISKMAGKVGVEPT